MFLILLATIDRWIERLCVAALLVSLLLMISLTILNMILRWFNTTFLWIEPLVRQLVFATAFFGGALATGVQKHIAIDLISRILERYKLLSLRQSINRLIYFFCIAALLWLTYAGYLLVLMEQEFGQVKFLGIHSAVLASMIPIGLLLIAYRFLFLLIKSYVPSMNSRI